MLLENETKNIFDKKLAINKIPKCKKSAKNIPFPNKKYSKNIKTLLPTRQSSTMTLKENSNLSQKYPSDNNFQIPKKSIFSSFQRSIKNKMPIFNFNKRVNSWEKSKHMKNDDSSSCGGKKIKIEQIHNYKIQYLLIKEKIKNIENQKDISIDIKNKIIQEINMKLKSILKNSNDYLEENYHEDNEVNENINDIEYNRKMLNIYSEKYNKWNNRLQEINNSNYISNLSTQINEIDNEINLYEKENEELLLNNNNNKKDLILPNIQKNNNIENDSILDRQLHNKIIEYKDKISQELSISKKIKDNEINIRKLDEIINNLNDKEKEIYNNPNEEMNTEGNNSNINNNIFMNINGDIFKFNKKRKVSKLNDLIPINRNNLNKTTSLKKDSQNRMITSENQSNLEENIYMIPFTTKRKNLSCSNISGINNNEETLNNNQKIKEIILKNLDEKEKEEKALINIYAQGDISLKKYKHIKLKPNFSFNNDCHKFKDDKINKLKKLQSSAEIANLRNNELNNINGDIKDNKEDLIKESVVDESSNKNENQNISSTEKNNKFNRNKRIKDINMEPIKKNFDENTKVNNDININKKERFSTATEQREKVLNTIMYDDL